jgi:hypothetical protein
MPLISTDRPIVLVQSPPPCGVGLWMGIRESDPPDEVWVVATAHCVAELDISRIMDQHNAVEIAEAKRSSIEAAASAKFRAQGANPAYGEHEGKPILVVSFADMSGIGRFTAIKAEGGEPRRLSLTPSKARDASVRGGQDDLT